MTAAASATPPHGSPRLPIKLQHGSAVAPRQKHKTRLAAGAVSIQNPPRGGFWGIRDHAKARLLDLAFLVRHMLAQARVVLADFHLRRRSEERRVGKEGVRTGRTRGSPVT